MPNQETFFRVSLATALRSVSREAISDGVTINNILPGPIMTARTAAYVASQSASTQRASNEVMTALTESIPAKRLGTPDEVGALCAYLCSADSGFITGQNICIDGGLTL
ncbi:SDR family oxidoreductase [Pseudomonas syringae]|uniref:SDR family oxidoreductase n=1 Tax=Pseudomonas syringae TaxID=317 RepID=UPI0024E0A714|nr:SDR family oxidoreductase [Pseudomonas syringae]